MTQYIREIRLKKQFPFLYVYKREESTLERIMRDVEDVYELLVIFNIISITLHFYDWCKKSLKEKLG